jgi:hypothetical protein
MMSSTAQTASPRHRKEFDAAVVIRSRRARMRAFNAALRSLGVPVQTEPRNVGRTHIPVTVSDRWRPLAHDRWERGHRHGMRRVALPSEGALDYSRYV